ncbi:MAG: glycosyltransferase family 2 protein [Bacteroidia bacterium]|nr:glycosyltransferase family 2 protein [Bacteroidia bacterium]
MASIRNRLITITGDDAGLLDSIKRIAYYLWAINLPKKLFQKLGLFPTAKAIAIEQVFTDLGANQPIYSGNAIVSIIIPTKNKFALVKACIDSIIQKSTYTHYEILVVNNQSTDEAMLDWLAETKKLNPNFLTIDAPIEFNFSRLVNLGVAHASGEYIILLNNDTEVISPDWIEFLLTYAQHDKAGVVGCKLLYSNRTIQHAGIAIFEDGTAGHVHVGLQEHDPLVNSVRNYGAVTAAAMLFSKKIFDQVNGFDEAFKVEFNDLDFCLKVLVSGYHNVYVPNCVLFHHESASRRHPFSDPKNHARYSNEQELFSTKWHDELKKRVDKSP